MKILCSLLHKWGCIPKHEMNVISFLGLMLVKIQNKYKNLFHFNS